MSITLDASTDPSRSHFAPDGELPESCELRAEFAVLDEFRAEPDVGAPRAFDLEIADVWFRVWPASEWRLLSGEALESACDFILSHHKGRCIDAAAYELAPHENVGISLS